MTHSKFSYETGDNHLKIEIVNCDNERVALDALIPLDEITFQRFISKNVMLRSKATDQMKTDKDFQFTMVNMSFYLEKRKNPHFTNSVLF